MLVHFSCLGCRSCSSDAQGTSDPARNRWRLPTVAPWPVSAVKPAQTLSSGRIRQVTQLDREGALDSGGAVCVKQGQHLILLLDP